MNTEIRTYRASSIHDALQQVRRDLGPQAFVVSTREVRTGGVSGLLSGRRCIEVLASLDEPMERPRRFSKKLPDHGIDLSALS